jgi:hypothetical protein
MKHATFHLLVILVVGLVFGCKKDKDDPMPSGKEGLFTLENERSLLTTSVDVAGDEIVLEQNTGSFDRITLNFPEGSYDRNIEHRISVVDVTGSTFNELIDPFYTALRVDNGGEESQQPISITFELDAFGPEVWGAFYYEEDPGELHGIPVIRKTDTEIEILVWHFSTIVLAKTEKEKIQNVGMRDLGFDVRENYWNFPNITTYLDSDGMCSGMTAGAMYFFGHPEVEDGFDQVFDNHPDLFQTPDYYDDDTRGIKFASTVQAAYSRTMQASYNYEYQDDVSTFWSTAYYLNHKNQPQVMILQGPAQGNHAVLVVGFTSEGANDGKLSIVDPNWYPASIREIKLVSGKLEDYESALNSKDLQDGRKFVFTDFVLFPHYKFMKSDLDMIWADVKNDVYRENEYRYPIIKYWVENAEDPTAPKIELQDLVDGGDTYVPYDRVKFSATNEEGIALKLFGRTGTEAGDLTDRDPLEGEFDLTNGDLFLGIGCWTGFEPNYNDRDWMDFQYSIVRKGTYTIETYGSWTEGKLFEEPGVPDQLYTLYLKNDKSLSGEYKCIWQFGEDGEALEIENDTFVNYTFKEEGEFLITVDVLQDGKSLGKASRKASIEKPWVPKFHLSLDDTIGMFVSAEEGFIGIDYPMWVHLNPYVTDPPTNLRYEWSFGDGTTRTVKTDTVRKTYYVKPNKRVVVTVYDDDTGEKVAQDSSYTTKDGRPLPIILSLKDDVLPNIQYGGSFGISGARYTFEPDHAIVIFDWRFDSGDEVDITPNGFTMRREGVGSLVTLEGSFDQYLTRLENVKLRVQMDDRREEHFDLSDVRFSNTPNDFSELRFGEPLTGGRKVQSYGHRHWDSTHDVWVELTEVDWSNSYVYIRLQ